MENQENKISQKDNWRQVILAERKKATVHQELKMAISLIGHKESALILGDASLVQSRYLLNEGFSHIVNVDSSPSLLDGEIIPMSDTRVVRELKTYDSYDPEGKKFDLVYGKSIAFNPKETIENVLQYIYSSLNTEGIFCADYAAEGDSFRYIYYTEEELRELYSKVGFRVEELYATQKEVQGLLNPGNVHEITIFARKGHDDDK